MMTTVGVALLALFATDPDGVVKTAPSLTQGLPQESQAALEATLAEGAPSTTVQTAMPHGLSTEDQISRWIGESRASANVDPDRPWARADEGSVGPRKPTGELSVGMGTGGYRDYAASVLLPLGEGGSLNLSVRHSRNDPWAYFDGYGPYDPHLGYGYGYGWRRGWTEPSSLLRSRERSVDSQRAGEAEDPRRSVGN